MDPAQPGHALVVLTNVIEPALETRDNGRTWTPLANTGRLGSLRSVFAGPDGWWGAPARGGLVHYEGAQWVPAMEVIARSAPGKTATITATKASAKPSKSGPTAHVAAAETVLAKSPVTAMVNDMAFGRGAWFAATEKGLLVSRDSGATWVVASGGSAHAVAASAAGNAAWAVVGHELMTSNDAGKNWIAQALPFEPRGAVRLHAADDSYLLLASDFGLFESRNAGESWRQSTLPELMIADMAVSGDNVAVATRKGSLFVSHDAGRTWARSAANVDSEGFPAVRTLAANSGIMAASATEGLFVLETTPRQSAAIDRDR